MAEILLYKRGKMRMKMRFKGQGVQRDKKKPQKHLDKEVNTTMNPPTEGESKSIDYTNV